METKMGHLAAVALVLAFGAAARAEERRTPVAVEIVEWGEYREEEPGPRVEAPDTTKGFVHEVGETDDPVLESKGPQVVARLGTRIGIKLRVAGTPSLQTVPLRIEVQHPPIVAATGERRELEAWVMDANVGIPRFAGWVFEDRAELVPGAWTFRVLSGDALLAERTFTVRVEPRAAGQANQTDSH